MGMHKLKVAATLAFLSNSAFVAVSADEGSIFKNLSIETLGRLNGDCRGVTEVNYRSQRLRSPDGTTSVYFSGVVRRIGQTSSRPGGFGAIKCTPYRLETPSGELIIEGRNRTRKSLSSMGFDRRFSGFYLVNPVSFSADGRYLVSRVDVSSNGLDGWTSYAILDRNKNYQPLSLYPCQNDEFGGDYQGFINPSEIRFECFNGQTRYSEILNLSRQTIRRDFRQTSEENQWRSHGAIAARFEIVRVQQFRPR
jgi:hypothetical protein